MTARVERSVWVVGGIPGAGKTTIARALAASLGRGVHIEADLLQLMIVSGRLWPDEAPRDEATRQLQLRLANCALLADSFFAAGFEPVIDDVIIGPRLEDAEARLRSRPLRFVLLVPRIEVVAQRDADRPEKHVFATWGHLDSDMREQTSRRGLWLDTSELTPVETVSAILERADEALL